MATRSIHITDQDMQRLRHVLSAGSRDSIRDRAHLESLAEELDRAVVVSAGQTPPDVVTMRTHVRIRDLQSEEESDYTVVYPAEGDVESNRISVLAPLGAALLGYREGDEIEWHMPGGMRRLRVERILYQPEAEQTDAEVERASDDYDELDRRLMDTFPASDAIARYTARYKRDARGK